MTMTLNRLHARLRAFARSTKKPVALGQSKLSQATELAIRDWRGDFNRMNELEVAEVATVRASITHAIGGVVIFGMQQFQAASLAAALEEARALENVQKVRNAMLRLDVEGGPDLCVAWRDAQVLHMGLDQYHAFLLERRKRAAHK